MVNKEQYFSRPRASFSRKTAQLADNLNHATACVDLGADFYLEHPILPTSNYDDRQQVRKYGDRVFMTGVEQVRDFFASPSIFRYEIIPDMCLGYAWEKDGRRHLVSLVDCIKGAQLYSYMRSLGGENVLRSYGNNMEVKVPSTKKKKDSYNILVKFLPGRDYTSMDWKDIDTNHTCSHTIGAEISQSQNFKVWCKHDIAAYLEAGRHAIREQGNVNPVRFNPFFLPSEQALEKYRFIQSRGRVIKNGNARLLNDMEVESLLWKCHGVGIVPIAQKGESVEKLDWTAHLQIAEE